MNILEAIDHMKSGHLCKLGEWIYRAYAVNKMEVDGEGGFSTSISHYLFAKALPYKEEKPSWAHDAVDICSWTVEEVASTEWEKLC